MICLLNKNDIIIIEILKEIENHKLLKRIISNNRINEIKIKIESKYINENKMKIYEDINKIKIIEENEYYYKCINNHICEILLEENKCLKCCIIILKYNK